MSTRTIRLLVADREARSEWLTALFVALGMFAAIFA